DEVLALRDIVTRNEALASLHGTDEVQGDVVRLFLSVKFIEVGCPTELLVPSQNRVNGRFAVRQDLPQDLHCSVIPDEHVELRQGPFRRSRYLTSSDRGHIAQSVMGSVP